MNYPVYKDYKKSDYPLIDRIPTKWTLTRIDFRISKIKHQLSANEMNNEDVIHYSIPNVQEFGKGILESGSDIDSNKLLIDKKQLLVSKLNPRKKTICIADKVDEHQTIASSEFVQIMPESNDINLEYLYYFYLSDTVVQFLSSVVQSVTKSHQRANPDDIRKIYWYFPTSEEQQNIASFLDYKTKQIDDLISKKEELLKLLEEKRIALITKAVTKGLNPNVRMKPSGIDWLDGDASTSSARGIPEHWEVKRLKFIAKIQFSNVNKKTEENEIEVLLCNYVDVYNNEFIDSKLDFMKATATEREIDKFLVEKGDVIATKDSETPFDIAVPALVIEELKGVLCGYHLAQIKPNQDILLPEYLFRLFQAVNFNAHFIVRANGVTRFGIGTDAFGDSIVPIIPRDEQKKIVDYIQDSCNKIDSLEKNIIVAIEKLKEYRTALITAAVTGKILIPMGDERDFKPGKNEGETL